MVTRPRTTAFAFTTACLLAAMPATAGAPSFITLEVDEAAADGGLGTIGDFAYDPTTDTYWTTIFGGGLGIRKIEAGTSGETFVFPSIQERFIRATDVVAGETDNRFAGSSFTAGMVLNPQAVTIDYGAELDQNNNPIGTITYQPGELAYIVDFNLRVEDENGNDRFDITKRLYTYDLRKVEPAPGSTTPVGLPDRNNAQNGTDPADTVIGAYNQVDWNDVFNVLVTEQDLRDAAGFDASTNFGREPAFSSDGQHLYAVDTDNVTGGVFKINASTGATTQIYAEPDTGSGSNVIAEPAVLASSLRNLGGGSGDQVLFDGSDFNGNPGGLSFIVDDGTPGAKAPQVALSTEAFAKLIGKEGSPRSITTDGDGNIYFFDSSADGLWRFDTDEKLISIVNFIQLKNFNFEQDGLYSDGGGMLRLKAVDDISGTTVFYRGDNSFIASVDADRNVADLTDDSNVDAADTAAFITEFNRVVNDSNPLLPGDAAYDGYVAADVNATGNVSSSSTGEVDDDIVDGFDLTTLRQFINLRAGDTDWDFDVDNDDYQTLRTNFDATGTDATFFEGNSNYHEDGDVDLADFVALRDSVNDLSPYSTASDDSVFTVLDDTSQSGPTPDSTLRLAVQLSGEVLLEGDASLLDGLQILGSDESLVELNYDALLGLDDALLGDDFIAQFSLTPSVSGAGVFSLGEIYNIGLDLRDLAFTYTLGGEELQGEVDYSAIPEPTTAAILLLTGGLALRRRRRD